MRRIDLNKEQRKHLASLLDKVAIGLFAVFGYTAWKESDVIVLVLSIVLFTFLEAAAIRILKEKQT